MTSFDRREEAFEAKFAHDQELTFKARARALRMLGLWAAGKRGEMGPAAEEYARRLIAADISTTPDAALNRLVCASPGAASTPRKFVKSVTCYLLSRNAPLPDFRPRKTAF
jgi:hypothetical protein